MRTLIFLALLSSTAYAETQDDGYCDYVEGVANAQSLCANIDTVPDMRLAIAELRRHASG